MLRKPKDIDTLYGEVAGYDIILTTDAPLATALNMRIARPTLGKRAFTPKEVAAKYAYRFFNDALLTEGAAIAGVAQRLSMPIKHVHNALRQIGDVRTHTRSVEQFLNEDERKIYSILSGMATPQRAREIFDPSVFAGKRVAVIGRELFNELDLMVLPETYDDIGIFTEERYDPAPLYTLPGEDAVVAALAPLLSKESENDIAIITSTSSGFTTRLKSHLYAAGITINERLFLHDNLHVRGVLSLLSYARRIHQATVRDIRPFLEPFGISVDPRYDGYNFSEYVRNQEEGDRIIQFYELLASCGDMTFGEVVRAFGKIDGPQQPDGRTVRLPRELDEAVGTLGLWNERVTDAGLSDLTYYVYNIPTKIASTKRGVVIVDCNQALYVDRPVCIYIGLDGSWGKEPRTAAYVDSGSEQRKDLQRFEVMLHQGAKRLYLTSGVRGTEGSIPSYYFNIIYRREINGFDDSLFGARAIDAIPDFFAPRRPDCLSIDGGSLDCFSQSSLNTFVTCPKKYEYSLLVPQTENNYLLKGTLLHAFAEFYASHPEYVKSEGADAIAEMLLDHYMGIVDEESRDVEYATFSIALKNIMAFVDSCDLSDDVRLSGVEKPSWKEENYLATALGMPISSPNVELFFRDESLHLKGVIDLIVNRTTIVDYKSSRHKKSTSQIMKLLSPELYTDEVDFQPLVYLLKLRSESPDSQLSFLYHFFLANKKDVIAGNGNHSDNTVEVRYLPESFAQHISRRETLERFATSAVRKAFLSEAGASAVASFFERHPLPSSLAFDDKIDESAYGRAFAASFGNKKGAGDLLKEIVRFRKGKSTINRGDQVLYLFSEDLDRFESFLSVQLEKVAAYRTEGYPKAPLDKKKVCGTCEYGDLCGEGW
jgi:hypothetical protein